MLQGGRVLPSAAVERAYRQAMSAFGLSMCASVSSAIRRVTLRVVRQRVIQEAARLAPTVATTFCNAVAAYTIQAFNELVARAKYHGATSTALSKEGRAFLRKAITTNTNLFKSLATVYLAKVDAAIRYYNDGEMTQYAFDKRIAELAEQVQTRCRIIASDQNNKVTEGLVIHRLLSNGIYHVRWRHSHLDKEPREYHIAKWDGHSGKRNGKPNGLDGYVFRLDQPPVIDRKTGERGYPSQLINCKCYLEPIFPNERTDPLLIRAPKQAKNTH